MADGQAPTRRDFIMRSALGAIALARGAEALAQGGGPCAAQEDTLLYVGTYTQPGRAEGLFLVRMDPRTGALRRVGAVDVGPNPSFLALAPGGRALYAVNEVTELDGRATGAVRALSVSADGAALLPLGAARHTEGGAPCYVSVAPGGRHVLVANYVGGNVAVLPVLPDGALGPPTHVVQHRGSGPRKEQESAHAHFVAAEPSGRLVLVADLGIDHVMAYRLEADGRLAAVRGAEVALEAGAGPRHLAFHRTLPLAYVANELDSTVTVLRLGADRTTAVASLSTLPDGWAGANQVADIHLGPAGDALYVSNRGHDSIAVFSVAPDGVTLARTQLAPTEGHWPRNFAMDPTGRWIVVANERADSLVVLARDPATGRLAATGRRLEISRPVCVRFRDGTA